MFYLFIFYSIAQWGYLGDSVNNIARQICKAKYLNLFFGSVIKNGTKTFQKTFRRSKLGNNLKFSRHVFLLCVSGIISISWGVIVYRQETEYYMCRVIFVQFSDEFSTALGAFSGVYNIVHTPGLGTRPKYESGRKGSEIFYCPDKSAWALSYGDHITSLPKDPCKSPRALSTETASFDITNVAKSPWFTYNEESKDHLVPLQHFLMSCYDCKDDTKFCGGGSCRGNRCECDKESYGLRCEFPKPCSLLEIDTQGDPLLGTRMWSDRFQRLSYDSGDVVSVYERPVYTSEVDPNGKFDIILYTGRRWVLTLSTLLGFMNHTTL